MSTGPNTAPHFDGSQNCYYRFTNGDWQDRVGDDPFTLFYFIKVDNYDSSHNVNRTIGEHIGYRRNRFYFYIDQNGKWTGFEVSLKYGGERSLDFGTYGADSTWRLLILTSASGDNHCNLKVCELNEAPVQKKRFSYYGRFFAYTDKLFLGSAQDPVDDVPAYGFQGALKNVVKFNKELTDTELTQIAAGAAIDSFGTPEFWFLRDGVDDLDNHGTAAIALEKFGSPTSVEGPSIYTSTPTIKTKDVSFNVQAGNFLAETNVGFIAYQDTVANVNFLIGQYLYGLKGKTPYSTFPPNDNIFNSDVRQDHDSSFECDATLPTTPANGILIEKGGNIRGFVAYLGDNGQTLKVTSNHNQRDDADRTALATTSDLPTDGLSHRYTFDIDINDSIVRVFIDGVLKASDGARLGFYAGAWSGGDRGGYGFGYSDLAIRETSADWPGTLDSDLRYYDSKAQLYSIVYEDKTRVIDVAQRVKADQSDALGFLVGGASDMAVTAFKLSNTGTQGVASQILRQDNYNIALQSFTDKNAQSAYNSIAEYAKYSVFAAKNQVITDTVWQSLETKNKTINWQSLAQTILTDVQALGFRVVRIHAQGTHYRVRDEQQNQARYRVRTEAPASLTYQHWTEARTALDWSSVSRQEMSTAWLAKQRIINQLAQQISVDGIIEISFYSGAVILYPVSTVDVWGRQFTTNVQFQQTTKRIEK